MLKLQLGARSGHAIGNLEAIGRPYQVLEHRAINWNHTPRVRHSHGRGNPDFPQFHWLKVWIPAFAGMTGPLSSRDRPML
jgi:hypothetical protein